MTGFSDAKQTISGTLSLDLSYDSNLRDAGGMGDPRDVILIKNFASSGDGGMKMAEMSLPDGTTMTGLQFVGAFKQSLDMTCFPFDRQTVTFDISMMHPGDKLLYFKLHCPKGSEAVNSSDGEVMACSQPIGSSSAGFEWDTFVCAKNDEGSITCSMEGKREIRFKLQMFIFPSVMFIMLSFLSFHFRVDLAMPRVATTMIALLNINLLRNEAQRQMPMVEEFSWMEEFLFAGVAALFLNMVSHAVAFHFASRPGVNELIDDTSGVVCPPLFFLYVFSRLSARECKVSAEAGALVAISTLFLCVAIALFVRRHVAPMMLSSRGSQERQRELDLEKGGEGSPAAPPLSDQLRHMLETAVADVWPYGDPQLAAGFADILRAHWIVSRKQLASRGLGGAASLSQATGLPLALCAELIVLAVEEGLPPAGETLPTLPGSVVEDSSSAAQKPRGSERGQFHPVVLNQQGSR